MKNVTIGIVARDEVINGTSLAVVTKNNLKYLDNLCYYIGILTYDNDNFNDDVLNLCDGIIIQGGSDIFEYHYKIVEYALKNNIPLLGICMGHQIIGLYSDDKDENKLVKVSNHYNVDKLHLVNIAKDSNLFKILGEKYYVNSRHLYKLDKVNKPFKVVARSDDNVIEAIEYIDDNHFIMSLQWHPEDMDDMQGLYNYFIKEVIKRKKSI